MSLLNKIGSGIGSFATGAAAIVSSGVAVVANTKYKELCESTIGSFRASTMMAYVMQSMNDLPDITGHESIPGFSGPGMVRELCNSYSNTTKLAIAATVVLATTSIFLIRRACSRA